MNRVSVTGLVCLIAGTLVASAQSRILQPLPEFDLPAGTTALSTSAYGLRTTPQHQTQEFPSTGFSVRLNGSVAVDAITTHYVTRLASLGWKQTFRAVDSRLGLVRFTSGSVEEPRTGILTVLPFASSGDTVVSIRLLLNRANWRSRPREGGAGANRGVTPQPAVLSFEPLSGPLTLPASVGWAENMNGGGTDHFYYFDARLETLAQPGALLDALLKQAGGPDWNIDVRAGDAFQTAIRRTPKSDPRRSEVWMLTTLAGANQMDVIVWSSCAAKPGRPKDPRARVPHSLPCTGPQ